MIEVNNYGVVRVLKISRAHRRNALDETTIVQFREAIREANNDANLRALVITGEGELAFCSGSDMKAAQEMTTDERIAHAQHGQELMEELNNIDLLTIAAVEGYALGGGFELALVCDLIVSSETGTFGLPEVQRSALPAWGGTYRTTKAIGLSLAKNMLLGSRFYTATEGYNLGFIYEVCQPSQACERSVQLALEIASKSKREVVAEAKKLLNANAYRSANESSAAEFEAEKRMSNLDEYGLM